MSNIQIINAFKEIPPEQPLILPFNPDQINFQPPIVIIPLTDSMLVEGRPLILLCKIIGKPIPKVYTLKFF
jgi:hypothetical protein